MKRGPFKTLVRGFLGTYTSRYAEYRGYWLFGFLVGGAPVLEIDLQGGVGTGFRYDNGPAEAARLQAMDAFWDLAAKLGLGDTHIKEARLTITVAPETIERLAGSNLRAGREMTLEVVVVAANGRACAASHTMFVAPHDPTREMQSSPTQAHWTARP